MRMEPIHENIMHENGMEIQLKYHEIIFMVSYIIMLVIHFEIEMKIPWKSWEFQTWKCFEKAWYQFDEIHG